MKLKLLFSFFTLFIFTAKAQNADSNLTTPTSSKIYTIVEDMPSFKGGEKGLMKYIKENIKYPKKARRKGIEGVVYVTFVVNRQGAVTDARVIRGVSEELDAVALKTIKNLPAWTPGRQNGDSVNVQYNVPVRFSLK